MKIIPQLLFIVVLFASTTVAADLPNTLRELIDDSIDWYDISLGAGSSEPTMPIVALRWPNTIRGSSDGATVIWVANGRPEAIAAMYTFKTNFVHEFNSLSRGRIVADRDDQTVWHPATNGLQFQPIDGAPEPARTRRLRLRQMKALAKEFSAKFLGWKSDNSQVEPLRRMSTPLYRYEIKDPASVQDGVLFAFVSGTDPEVVLVLESFRVGDAYQWQYAFVRRSSAGLKARHKDQLVWAASKFPKRWDPELNHIAFKYPLAEVMVEERESDDTNNGEGEVKESPTETQE